MSLCKTGRGALAAFAVLASTPALAAAPPAPAAGDYLTLDELRACAERNVANEAEELRLAGIDGQLEVRKRKLDADQAAIEAERAALNKKDKAAIKAFNERIDLRQEEADAFNKAIDTRNADSDKRNAEVSAFNTACAQRRFRDADVAKLPPELQKVVRGNSSTIGVKKD